MNNKKTKTIIIISASILILIPCCILSILAALLAKDWNKKGDAWIPKLSNSLELFEDDEEFDNYIDEIIKDYDNHDKGAPFAGIGDVDYEAEESTTAEEDITNIQEAGVDEGDIVKAYMDYLLILRRGRIFTVRISNDSDNNLDYVSHTNAYPDGYTNASWYDELLVYENRVIVIGYSYQMAATEIGIFEIDSNGIVDHQDTYFIDSNDYYSSRNYASRLIDDELILYMPFYLFTWNYNNDEYRPEIAFPEARKWIKGNETTEGESILDKTDIYKPIQDSYSPTLHTIIRCNLRDNEMNCRAKAVLGPYSRSFYVSPNAIYLWVNNSQYIYHEEEEKDDPYAYVYMILLKDDTARSIRADGNPIDQFSFKEDEYGYLNVLVSKSGGSDAMWESEFVSGELALLRVPLEKFTDEADLVSKDSFTILPSVAGYTIQNRFIGDTLLYGSGTNWYYDENSENKIYIKNYTNKDETVALDLTHSVDRIDKIGEDGIAIGSNENDLVFTSIDLTDSYKADYTYTVQNAMQGEYRSHAFFYKEIAGGEGYFGLPVRKESLEFSSLLDESAEILFLHVSKENSFTKLGTLKSDISVLDDNCEYSCVDWYGNTRPIFYSSRIFGLLGYEIVEGKVMDGNMTEVGRLNFAPN